MTATRARLDEAWATGMRRAVDAVAEEAERAERDMVTARALSCYVRDRGGYDDPEWHLHVVDGLREAHALVLGALERATARA